MEAQSTSQTNEDWSWKGNQKEEEKKRRKKKGMELK